ncbi:uncharacterized protein LOC141655535 [Silene latifolia]|uniref:uncharacterized protein LOC141655535 n=1 Tax=Silene latifolia TaxID=37657 RepID=UPI003D7827C6
MYAYNDGIGRRDLWQKLGVIAGQCSGPWALAGDFNTVINPAKRLGANTKHVDMDEFLDCISICGVADIGATSAYFTWTNKQDPSTRVFSRLDRFMVNQEWMNQFPNMMAHFHPEGLFDHCPCTWQKHYPGHKMFNVIKKLKALKPALKRLNKECYADVVNSTAIAEAKLHALQIQLVQDIHNPELLQKELEVAASLKNLTVARDSFLSQKAKSQWLEAGDSNTTYFHGAIKKRISMNKVIQIEDQYGTVCSDSKSIQNGFLDYYQTLLGSNKPIEKLRVIPAIYLGEVEAMAEAPRAGASIEAETMEMVGVHGASDGTPKKEP